MKATNPHDAVLSELLRLRRITVTLPPQFCDGVWRRIEREEAGSNFTLFAALTAWIESTLPRAQIASCYLAALMLVGIASGLWTAHGVSHRLNTALSVRYVQSVDPYQTVISNQ